MTMRPLLENDPRQIGRYRLVGRLGAGGMGQVYLGVGGGGEQAAVKVVHPGFAHDDRFRARFAREVEISRKVTGPWTAAVLDADPHAATPWLATEYVQGLSLGQVVRATAPLPPDAVHVLASGLANALVVIHRAGLIHRDLKPSNVLLATGGPRLIDFGISRAIDGTRMTSTGMVIGTPAFMSPEQAEGAELGPESDVFSLGAVLVLAATGVGPFGDSTPVVLLRRVLTADPDLGSLTEPVRGLVAECLRRGRDERPTAAELVERLHPVPPPAPSGWLPESATALIPQAVPDATRVSSPIGRRGLGRRTVLLGAGALGLAGVGLGAAALSGSRGAGGPSPVSTGTPRIAWSFKSGGEIASLVADSGLVLVSDENNSVYALDVANGQIRWNHAVPSANMLTLSGDSVVVGGTVTYALDAGTGRRRWERRSDLVAVSGQHVLTAELRSDNDSFVRELVGSDIAGGTPQWARTLRELSEGERYRIGSGKTASSPGGLHIAPSSSSDEWRLETIDPATGAVRWVWPSPPGAQITSVVAVRDTVYVVAFGGSGDEVVALDALSGSERWKRSGADASNLVADPDGIYVTAIGAVQSWDGTAGTERWKWDPSVGGKPEFDIKSMAAVSGGSVVLGTSENLGIDVERAKARSRYGLAAVADGALRWQLDFEPTETQMIGPLVADQTVLVAIGDTVHAVVVE
jgi:eukaryotic-like serine/threonine-protein kinase